MNEDLIRARFLNVIFIFSFSVFPIFALAQGTIPSARTSAPTPDTGTGTAVPAAVGTAAPRATLLNATDSPLPSASV